MSEFPTRQVVVTVPLHVYEALAARLPEGGESVESFVAELLEAVVRFGTPGEVHAAAHLAAQVADTLADRWAQRNGALTQIHADMQRIVAALGRLVEGA
jgi:hypothetical protein